MPAKVSEYNDRLAKLKKIKQLGLEPYPAQSGRDHLVSEVLAEFSKWQKTEKPLTIAGRLRSWRRHGNLSFAHLEDASGRLQIAFSKAEVGADSYKILTKLVDVGDFLEVKGIAFTTRKGEKSLMAKEWRFLAKALRPLPDKWHGFKDEEERLRKRYLDILFNPEVREIIEKRAKFWQAVRQFLLAKGFLEVETPVLEVMPGGADAKPFITHHNALDLDVYLRISMGELWQKRLMVAGLEKTFEIGRQFRNEGMDAEHLQDYTQMEFYWAYADYRQGMELVKELYRFIAQETFGTLQFKIRGFAVDLGKDWVEYDYVQTIKKMTGLDVLAVDLKTIEAKLQELGVEYEKKGFNLARAIDNLWKYCRKKIAGPGFLVNEPAIVSPLAKKKKDNPELVERFHVLIAGSELGNGYSELNDPLDQAERFRAQQALRAAGDEEAHRYDEEFIEALEYGMPPTCGFGMSERLFAFLLDKPARFCQIFPLLRPKKKE